MTLIRHIVMFNAKQPDDLPAIEAGLLRLADIGEHKHFEVRRNLACDQIANEMELVVYAEFENTEALARYKAHPIYAEAIRIVRPLRNQRIAADIVGG